MMASLGYGSTMSLVVPDVSADIYRLLIESVQDYAIFVLDPRGHIATWNTGAQRIKGYNADEIIGQHFSTFYSAQDIADGKPARELIIAAEEGRVEDEGWRIRKDGTRFWANIIITALRDSQGRLTGFGKVTRDLTQRRAAEEELRRSEERFRLLVESSDDYAIYMLDATGRVSSWNAGARKIKGFEAHEIVGKSFATFFTADAIAANAPERELVSARDEGRFEEEAWRVRKDGSRFWANVVLTPIRDAQGTLLGFTKITRDLTTRRAAEDTERKLIAQQAAREAAEAAEARLRVEGERYRALSRRLEVILAGVGDGITAQDRHGALVFANIAAARTCGFDSVEQLLAAGVDEVMTRFEILDEKGRPFDVEELPGRKAMRTGEPATELLRVRNMVTGTDSWSLVRASAVVGSDDVPELAVNIWHDVSEQYRREESERYLATATAALSSSLDHGEMLSTLARLLVPGLADWCVIDLLEGDQLVSASVAHVDASKLALARDFQRRYPPDPSSERGVWGVIRSGHSELHEAISDAQLVARGRDAEHLSFLRELGIRSAMIVPILIRERAVGAITLVANQARRSYDRIDLPLAEDIGRRTGSSLENARLYAAEKHAARLAAEAAQRAEEASRIKDEFLATVSHELRTPLNAIVGWAHVLRERNADPNLTKGIAVIDRNAHAQAKIIEDILDVSRIITGNLRLELDAADFCTTIRNAIEVITPSAGAKGIAIDLVVPAEACTIVADHERLQQVVWNLLSNAVKFTGAGGTITVSLQREATAVALSITDTGTGIDPEFLPYVFDRFKQADGSTTRRVGGLGLGLAIVRHIVELHGGRAVAHSAGLGQGASFTIVLPLHAKVPAFQDTPRFIASDSRSSQPDLAEPSLAGVRVVLIDDEADTRELLQTVLIQAGASVEVGGTASEGLALLQTVRPHVLISDIGMPIEDGYSFMRRVRSLESEPLRDLPALALSAYTRGSDRGKALAVGFTAHLGKPVSPRDLVRTVARLAKSSAK
jgi:PAS domain S-box-containing protein